MRARKPFSRKSNKGRAQTLTLVLVLVLLLAFGMAYTITGGLGITGFVAANTSEKALEPAKATIGDVEGLSTEETLDSPQGEQTRENPKTVEEIKDEKPGETPNEEETVGGGHDKGKSQGDNSTGENKQGEHGKEPPENNSSEHVDLNKTVDEENRTETPVIPDNETVDNQTKPPENQTEPGENETVPEEPEEPGEPPHVNVEIQMPPKVTRGEAITVKAIATSNSAEDVVLEWTLPEGFTLLSGDLVKDCGSLKHGSCNSIIEVETTLDTDLGESEIRVDVKHG